LKENGSIRILHIDDNEDYLNLLELRLPLEDKSIVIEKAKSGKVALNLLSKKNYDCVLVDYEMPGMNGLEFLEIAKEQHMLIPYIFLTGQGNEEVAAQAFRLGADDYFTKDTTFAHFPRLVNSIKQNIVKYHHMKSEQSAADALLKRERQLMALVSSMDELILLVNSNGVIVECFKPAKKHNSFIENDDLLGKKLVDILPGEMSPVIKQALKQIKKDWEGKEYDYLIEPDNDTHWHRIKILPFLNTPGDINDYLILIQDISERMASRRKLIESEKRYRFILENTFDYIYQIDMRTGKYDFISPKAAEIIGIPLDVIMSTPNFGRNIILPEDKDKMMLVDRLRERNPEKENLVSYRMRTGNNEIKYFEQRSRVILVEGEPRYVIGVFRDITESVRTENFNKRLQEVYREFFTQSADAVVLVTDNKGNIIDVVGDITFGKKNDFPKIILKNKNVKDFLDKKYYLNNRNKILMNFKEGLHFEEYFLLESQNKKFYLYAKAVAINDYIGNIERVIILLQDVTDKCDSNQPQPEFKIIFN
jgi:PAS domain S-box-containing protein